MIIMIIMIIIIISSSSSIGIIFSFYGFVKLLLMQSLQSCFPQAATAHYIKHDNNEFPVNNER